METGHSIIPAGKGLSFSSSYDIAKQFGKHVVEVVPGGSAPFVDTDAFNIAWYTACAAYDSQSVDEVEFYLGTIDFKYMFIDHSEHEFVCDSDVTFVPTLDGKAFIADKPSIDECFDDGSYADLAKDREDI